MEALRKIYVALGLDWDSAGFAQALTAANLLEEAAKGLVAGFKMLANQLVSSVTETAAFGALITDTAARTGIATDALQELGYAAALSGTSQETLFSALTRLTHKMGEAKGGSESAAKAFSALGVRFTDGAGGLRAADEVFNDLVASLGAIKNPTDRSAKAIEIFGRQGVELLPLLAEGEAGLKKLREQFNALGLVLDKDGVAAANAFSDSLDTINALLASLSRDLGGPIIEALQPVLDGMLEWVAANRELIRSKIQQFARGLIAVVRLLWRAATGLADSLQEIVAGLKLVGMVIGSFLLAKFVLLNAALLETLVAWALNTTAATLFGAASLAAAGKAAIAWLAAAAPVILLTGALVLAALAAEDVYGYLTGADSVIGELGPKWTAFLDEWTKPHDGDSGFMQGLRLLVKGLADLEGVALPALKQAWADVWSFVKNTAMGVIYDIVIAFQNLGQKLHVFFGGVEDVIRAVVPGARRFEPGPLEQPFSPGGGAASPAAAAASSSAAAAPGATVLAPRMNAQITVNVPAGTDAQGVGVLLNQQMDSWFDTKVRELVGTAGGE